MPKTVRVSGTSSRTIAIVALGLSSWTFAASTTWARSTDVAPARYATPPPSGTYLRPQSGLFRCASVAGARSSAETGFLAHGCQRVEREGVWRVVGCSETTLSHGPLRLVEVVADDGTRAWVPLPWHDWA